MSGIIDWARASWTNIVWAIAGIILMIDPQRIFEWGHRHEGWSDLIIVLWFIIATWAAKQRPQTGRTS
jgi:hypothetical protein